MLEHKINAVSSTHLQDHVQLCEYEDVFCDDCNEELQRRSLNKHQTAECHNRIVQCEHCAVEFAFRLTEVRLYCLWN